MHHASRHIIIIYYQYYCHYYSTRLPSNPRPTTRKSVHLVMRGHFRSRDKDGGYINRSVVTNNPMLHANFTALCFIEPELLLSEVLHSENRDFQPFWSCDLDFDPMTFIYEPDLYSLEMYRMSNNELPTYNTIQYNTRKRAIAKALQLEGHSDFAQVDRAYYQHFLFLFVRKYRVFGSSAWQPQMQVT